MKKSEAETKIGKTVKKYGSEYKITNYKPYSEDLKNIIKICNETGKFPGVFFAKKVLKNGELSEKQVIGFWMFRDSENIVIL